MEYKSVNLIYYHTMSQQQTENSKTRLPQYQSRIPCKMAEPSCLKSRLTLHAIIRSRTRGIREAAIERVLEFGKHRARRGADVYTLGWREVRLYAERGLNLGRWEGIEVVCAHSGQILTVYRNKNRWAIRDRSARRRTA